MEIFQIWIGNVEEGLLSNIIDFSPVVHPTFSDTNATPSINCDRNVTITWQHNDRVRKLGKSYDCCYECMSHHDTCQCKRSEPQEDKCFAGYS